MSRAICVSSQQGLCLAIRFFRIRFPMINVIAMDITIWFQFCGISSEYKAQGQVQSRKYRHFLSWRVLSWYGQEPADESSAVHIKYQIPISCCLCIFSCCKIFLICAEKESVPMPDTSFNVTSSHRLSFKQNVEFFTNVWYSFSNRSFFLYTDFSLFSSVRSFSNLFRQRMI